MSGFFYSFTFARSHPNVASAVYSRTYLNGELAGVLLNATCSAAVAAVGCSGGWWLMCWGLLYWFSAVVAALVLGRVWQWPSMPCVGGGSC